ncbi:MAG: fused MFS/spermidine synthase [Deltaproteobacteria bacterium]|jgi:spermidine synthase|nr:fused MFS/spermidine synthase [Deltaproteobacteria bacterium]
MKEKPPGTFAKIFSALTSPFVSSAPTIIFEADSDFSHITIVENEGIRTLYLGSMAQEAETSIQVANPYAPVFEYPGIMLLALALCQKNKNILLVGLGGGFIPSLFQKYLPEHKLTVVEVDPLISEIASIYFYFNPGKNVELVIADGKEHLKSKKVESFDQIWMDAFSGDYIPQHLASEDFFILCHERLVEGGLLVQNLHISRMHQYFQQLSDTKKIFPSPPLVFKGRRSSNAVVMSYKSPAIAHTLKTITKAAKEFGPQVGPYDLTQEANKLSIQRYDF